MCTLVEDGNSILPLTNFEEPLAVSMKETCGWLLCLVSPSVSSEASLLPVKGHIIAVGRDPSCNYVIEPDIFSDDDDQDLQHFKLSRVHFELHKAEFPSSTNL